LNIRSDLAEQTRALKEFCKGPNLSGIFSCHCPADIQMSFDVLMNSHHNSEAQCQSRVGAGGSQSPPEQAQMELVELVELVELEAASPARSILWNDRNNRPLPQAS